MAAVESQMLPLGTTAAPFKLPDSRRLAYTVCAAPSAL